MDMQVFHQAWVLSRMRIEIKRLPKWRDVVRVKTWIKSLENSRSVRCMELYIGDEKIVGCETFWVVMNTKTRKPEALALPHEHFEKFPKDSACEKEFSKIKIPEKLVFASTKTIQLSDLDIVNHANSIKYLEWCLDYVDYKVLLKQEIKAFEMNYLKEVALHELITINKNEADSNSIITVSKEDKICFALELEM